MDEGELRAVLVPYFNKFGFTQASETPATLDLLFAKDKERFGLILCPDRDDGMAYLGAFEAAMQRIVDTRQADDKIQVGTAVAFASTAQGNSPSYRRALKKYSNSIVFEDLGLHLLLVTGDQVVDWLKPKEVNAFLRDLDNWIAARRRN